MDNKIYLSIIAALATATGILLFALLAAPIANLITVWRDVTEVDQPPEPVLNHAKPSEWGEKWK